MYVFKSSGLWLIGMYAIPLDRMEAHPTLSVREIKEWYVTNDQDNTEYGEENKMNQALNLK